MGRLNQAALAHQAVENNKADQEKQKAKIANDESLAQNRIVLSNAYKQAVYDYEAAMGQIYQNAYDKAMAEANANPNEYWTDSDTGRILTAEEHARNEGSNAVIEEGNKYASSAINRVFYNAIDRAGHDMLANMDRNNPYKHSKYDQHRSIDMDNITPDQMQELNEYALNLLNDVRAQIGSHPLVLNGDVEHMAQDIADQYTADEQLVIFTNMMLMPYVVLEKNMD